MVAKLNRRHHNTSTLRAERLSQIFIQPIGLTPQIACHTKEALPSPPANNIKIFKHSFDAKTRPQAFPANPLPSPQTPYHHRKPLTTTVNTPAINRNSDSHKSKQNNGITPFNLTHKPPILGLAVVTKTGHTPDLERHWCSF